jgi:hypothetical protein
VYNHLLFICLSPCTFICTVTSQEVKRQREAERRAAFAAEQARLLEEVEALARAGPQPGPHLELSHTHLQLSTSTPSPFSPYLPATEPSSSTDFASFTLKHNGTAAVYYTWVPQPIPMPPFSTLAAAAEPLSSGLHLSKMSGAVLPGETVEFKVAFRPDRSGELLAAFEKANSQRCSVLGYQHRCLNIARAERWKCLSHT